MSFGQINLLDEIIVDSFAGGGGASTGIELATGRVVDIAINHDPDAILMHRTNHPHTQHFQASVWDVDPEEVCRGRSVGLLWASPDCKHFSKAKGGKPVDCPAVGRDCWPQGHHPGERRGVPDLGTRPPGPPREVEDGTNLPAVHLPTGGPGLCCGVAGAGGG